jgi:hypothetical protein
MRAVSRTSGRWRQAKMRLVRMNPSPTASSASPLTFGPPTADHAAQAVATINVSVNARASNVTKRIKICRLRTPDTNDTSRPLAGPIPTVGLKREWKRGAERSAPSQSGIQVSRTMHSHTELRAGQKNSRKALSEAAGDHVARR